jgi:molecular chaperone HtpG
MQKALQERASAVRVTHRLTDSPACLVSDDHRMSTIRAAPEGRRTDGPTTRPIRDQPVAPDREATERRDRRGPVRRLSHILFDQATLAEGGQLGSRRF